MLMQLRKCCNHAYLFDSAIHTATTRREERAVMIGASGKLECLEQLLPELKASGHRVLIFSQFTSMLDLLGTYMDFSGHTYSRIDGTMVSGTYLDFRWHTYGRIVGTMVTANSSQNKDQWVHRFGMYRDV